MTKVIFNLFIAAVVAIAGLFLQFHAQSVGGDTFIFRMLSSPLYLPLLITLVLLVVSPLIWPRAEDLFIYVFSGVTRAGVRIAQGRILGAGVLLASLLTLAISVGFLIQSLSVLAIASAKEVKYNADLYRQRALVSASAIAAEGRLNDALAAYENIIAHSPADTRNSALRSFVAEAKSAKTASEALVRRAQLAKRNEAHIDFLRTAGFSLRAWPENQEALAIVAEAYGYLEGRRPEFEQLHTACHTGIRAAGIDALRAIDLVERRRFDYVLYLFENKELNATYIHSLQNRMCGHAMRFDSSD